MGGGDLVEMDGPHTHRTFLLECYEHTNASEGVSASVSVIHCDFKSWKLVSEFVSAF